MKTWLFPTEVAGMSLPSSVIPVTSMMAVSRSPKKPHLTYWATAPRWKSKYSILPKLIFSRATGSELYGIRSSIPSTIASAPSSSLLVEAPVITTMRNFPPLLCSRRMCSASACGTNFGYPDPVNPLMPTL